MKILIISGLSLLLGGCALFGGGESTTAGARSEAAPSAASPERTARAEAFRPAYGIGRPVALIPCSKGATINDDCVGANTRHQIGGERAAQGDEPALSEISVIPVKE